MSSSFLQKDESHGVTCFLCGRPIRVSTSLAARKAGFDHLTSNAQEWRSKVFSLRCRNCGHEALYALSQIQDFLPGHRESPQQQS
jgi:ribosomal protein S27E